MIVNTFLITTKSKAKVYALIKRCLWETKLPISIYLILTTIVSSISPAKAWFAKKITQFLETGESREILSMVESLGNSLKGSVKIFSADGLSFTKFIIIIYDWLGQSMAMPLFNTVAYLILLYMLMAFFFGYQDLPLELYLLLF